jgi:predicted secreted Zn-dependent protease
MAARYLVIPAKAGIQRRWTPAFAGVTAVVGVHRANVSDVPRLDRGTHRDACAMAARYLVIPAKAGIQRRWTPAFAGVTAVVGVHRANVSDVRRLDRGTHLDARAVASRYLVIPAKAGIQ